MKRLGSLLMIGACLVVAAGCGSSGNTSATANTASSGNGGGPVETHKLTLAIGPDPAFATQAVAIKKGWFRDAGFTSVSTKNFTSGVEAGQAVASGGVDLWSPGNLPPISLSANGVPVEIVGNNAIAHVEFLVARPDAHIQSPTDLYKARVAILQGSTQGAFLANLAQHYGLDLKKIKTVNLTPPEELSALLSGDVQAAVMFPPFNFQAVQKIGAQVLAGRKSGFAQDKGQKVDFSHTRNVFVMSKQFLQNDPNAAKAVMKVLLKAQSYVADPAHKTEVIKTYADFSKTPVSVVQEAWPLYTFTPTIDQSYVADQNNYAQYLKSSGALKGSPPSPFDYTDLSLLKQLDQSAVQVSGSSG